MTRNDWIKVGVLIVLGAVALPLGVFYYLGILLYMAAVYILIDKYQSNMQIWLKIIIAVLGGYALIYAVARLIILPLIESLM